MSDPMSWGVRFRQSAISRLRWEVLLVAVAALLSIVVHHRYAVTGLGETDATRLARDSIGWHLRGYVTGDGGSYTQRTSLLYLQLERVLLDHGLSISSLPRAMNWLSTVLGTACSVALYALFRALTEPRKALFATLIHALTPGFWLGNIYGMPTVPGLCFFVLSLLAFLHASRRSGLGTLGFWVLSLASFLGLFVAMGFKADLALSCGAFLAVALARPGRRVPLTLGAAAIVGGASAGIVLYRRLIVTGAPGANTASFLKEWNEHFPFRANALLTDANNTTIVRCAGGVLFSVIVLALIHGLVSGGALRRGVLLAALWGLPPILFWGFQFDNSARHNVPAFPPLVLCATLFLFHSVGEQPRRAAALIALIMSASYLSNTWGNGSIVPQSNLLALSERVEALTQGFHQKARELSADPSPKRLVLNNSEDPYVLFEVMARAKQPRLETLAEDDLWQLTDGPQVTRFFFGRNRGATRAVARRHEQRGFTVLSMARY